VPPSQMMITCEPQLGSSVLHLRTLRPVVRWFRRRSSPQFPGIASPVWHGSGTGVSRELRREGQHLRDTARMVNVAPVLGSSSGAGGGSLVNSVWAHLEATPEWV
jgi:hypothetical protein